MQHLLECWRVEEAECHVGELRNRFRHVNNFPCLLDAHVVAVPVNSWTETGYRNRL